MLKHYLPLAIVPVALILWGLFGATILADNAFSTFVDYYTLYTEPSPPSLSSTPLTPQVVLVVVDGLRLDESRTMANLNALRAKGANRTMQAGQPSLSLPGWAVIGTGAWQEQHGQTSDYTARPLGLDSIFQAAHRNGLTTALAGSPAWTSLFVNQIDTVRTEPDPPGAYQNLAQARKRDDAIEANALAILKEQKPNLLLVHFTASDNAYHGFGVNSPEGRRATQDADARIGRLVQALDLNQTTLLITSDHGQVERGGNGGAEDMVLNVAFVVAGKAIQPGVYPPAQQTDIAPTIATLLGAGIPWGNQGEPLFDLLVMPPHALAQRTADWAQQLTDRYAVIAKVIGVGTIEHRKLAEAQQWLAAGNDTMAVTAARADVQATRDAVFAAHEGRLQQERLLRTPLFLLFLLPSVVYALFMRDMEWEFKRPLIAAAIYFIAFYALYSGHGYTLSLSMLNGAEQASDWFSARVVDALGALVVSAAVLGLLSRGEFKTWTVLNTIHLSFFVAFGLWLQVCIYY